MLQPLQTVAMAVANGNEIKIFHQYEETLFVDPEEGPNPREGKSTELGEKLCLQMDWRRRGRVAGESVGARQQIGRAHV